MQSFSLDSKHFQNSHLRYNNSQYIIQLLTFKPILDNILAMINLTQKTPPEISNNIAHNLVSIRKRRKLSQEKLASKSGVSLGSLKRFEHTGEISLTSLIKLSIALELEEELNNLFSEVPYKSIQELIDENTKLESKLRR